MPVFICRWPNGDVSFVSARSKQSAIFLLDEVANAEGCPVSVARDFMVHFQLSDIGELEVDSFGERTEETLDDAYPLLRKARIDASKTRTGELTEEGKTTLRVAVLTERERVKAKPGQEPMTELGKELKPIMGAATVVVERAIGQAGLKILENTPETEDPS